MSTSLEKLAEGIGTALETVPEFYKDTFQPAAQETGKLMARIPRAINAAFSGLDKWILNKEYGIDETKKLLAQKLQNAIPEKIVEPDPYIAVPVIQAISYSMNSNDLRDLYANLLAKSMIEDSKNSVHPSFVEIIKQLSPFDAKMLKRIYTYPFGSDNQDIHFSDISNFGKVCVSVDNLIRLGLISVPFDMSFLDDSGYNYIRKTDVYAAIASELDSIHNRKTLSSNYIKNTTFGASFYNVCIHD